MILKRLIIQLLRIVISMRYSIHIKGLKEVEKELEKSSSGALFLPNHPSEMDPVLVSLALGAHGQVRPLIVGDFYFSSFMKLMKRLRAIPIPNFDDGDNSFKRACLKKTMQTLKNAINGRERVLLYPAGMLKRTSNEELGGKSLLFDLLKDIDKPNIVLVRTQGMWGSSFSAENDGKTPNFVQEAKKGFIAALLNGIFFMPRRKISIQFEMAHAFPFDSSKDEVNSYLEAWYNQYSSGNETLSEEPLQRTPYYFWSRSRNVVAENKPKKALIDLSAISDEIIESVLKQISFLSKKSVTQIKINDDLSQDLSLDSLDKAELVAFLSKEFSVSNLRPDQLKTVASVLGYASDQLRSKKDWVSQKLPRKFGWKTEVNRPALEICTAETIPEVFIDTAVRLKKFFCCGDAITGPLTYKEFLLRASLLASKLRKKIPAKNVGILLPATSACYLVIMALLFSGKVPVMLNWTVGKRNLKSMKKSGGIDVVISSYAFLSQLQNVDISPIEEDIFLLEELKCDITLRDKLNAFYMASFPRCILKKMKSHAYQSNDPAVLLFTSGTESYPKGVPLSHHNILSNLQSILASIDLKPDDILYGILPPFHSFGFSVTGLLPLLSGIKVAFSPNPTHAVRIANGIKKWGITFMCLAPTFLKGILRVSKPKHLESLRLVVTGAEKLPDDVKKLFHKALAGKAEILEGYGTTECSPVLTANLPGQRSQGVGTPLKGIEIAIIDPETRDKMGINERGLVIAHGGNIFSGYLGTTPEGTFVNLEGKKWYNTGDLGYLDERGYLTLVGRLKRFIKIGGEMISLPAIEEAILEKALEAKWPLHPDRPSFIVIPIEYEGERPRLTLFTSLSLDKQEVNQSLNTAGFSNLVKIHQIEKLKEIPILGTGKVDFQGLKRKL